MNISVVVPSYNESESLPELCTWIEKVMISNSRNLHDNNTILFGENIIIVFSI